MISGVGKWPLATMAVSLFAGCATRPDQVSAAAQPVCEREYRTGSNIPVLSCSVPPTDAERQRAAEELRTVVRPAPSGSGTKGGTL
jgi:hypothetical protein